MKLLERRLKKIGGRGYPAYKELRGQYDFGDFQLMVHHIQPDPFAPPSRLIVNVDFHKSGFPKETLQNGSRKLALEDFINRTFAENINKFFSGEEKNIRFKRGVIAINHGGQEIIKRSAVNVTSKNIEVRFYMSLPAFGRRIDEKGAAYLFFNVIPEIVKKSLFYKNINRKKLEEHIACVEDYYFIRSQLDNMGIVAFIANDSILPRKSGLDDRPRVGGVVKFKSPSSFEVSINTPHRGEIKGLGIPRGITVITGGGFHGKSTLLNSITMGVYPHIPGDGREYVVTHPTAMKIKAEDGRFISKVDISPFIGNLPLGKNTKNFSTDLASGSTSMAASIVEAIEVGVKLLLIDEDTAATNFMIKDEVMREFLSPDKEPITPFIERIREIYDKKGVSTILVTGGSGEYLKVADNVIVMDNFVPVDKTRDAKDLVKKFPIFFSEKKEFSYNQLRLPMTSTLSAARGKYECKIDVKPKKTLHFGEIVCNLDSQEQIVEQFQILTIGYAIHYLAKRVFNGRTSIRDGIEYIVEKIEREGFDCLTSFKPFNLSLPRREDIAVALNRFPNLSVKIVEGSDG